MSPTAAASQTNLFSIVGKYAQTSGVQTMRAAYVDATDPSSDYLEVFATSRPGQKIMLSGVGIGTTQMKGVTTGRGDLYYAKVLVPGAPVEVKATNQTDGTSWTTKVTDLVDVTAARYDLGTKTLTVAAHSSKPGAILTAFLVDPLLANGDVEPDPDGHAAVEHRRQVRRLVVLTVNRCGSSVRTSSPSS